MNCEFFSAPSGDEVFQEKHRRACICVSVSWKTSWDQKPLQQLLWKHIIMDCVLISMRTTTKSWIYMWLHSGFSTRRRSGVLLFGGTVFIKILVVFFLSYFISSFHNFCCDVATSKCNLGFTDYQKEADLKWFIVKGTEVRSRPTAHGKLLILLFCLKHWARPLLALVVLLQNCFWNALIFEMQIPWHFRWNLIGQVYFSEEILRNLTT